MRIALVSIAYSPSSGETLQRLFDALFEAGVELYLYSLFHDQIREEIVFSGDVTLFSDTGPAVPVDYYFSVGGDGTFLHTVNIVKDSGIPILGINMGRLG